MRVLFLISTGDSLATSVHSYSNVLQTNTVGNNDEVLGKEAKVLSEIERRGRLVSNLFGIPTYIYLFVHISHIYIYVNGRSV